MIHKRLAREECAKDDVLRHESRQDPETTDDYIKGPDKFPLGPNRYGYLPIAIQKFLNTNNKKCQISITNTNLKKNHPCILRHGVEINKLQSFVACIADVMVDDTKKSTQTIVEMKETLIKSLSIDRFMTLQNGNLIEIFDSNKDVNLDKYVDSKIYQATDKNDPAQMTLLRQVVRSYENYISFLRDNNVKIDYQYLWDLICQPNPKLFKNGLNMAIIELKDDDITDNIQVLCPSNHYASTFFDVNRKTIILMKIGNYFEPIYSFEDTGDDYRITRRFSLKDKHSHHLLPNIKKTLELIKTSMENKCSAFPSMTPTVYKFGTNIVLERLVHFLNLKNFTIETQIMNYNGRVIGVIASKDSLQGVIPCFPSAPMMDLTPDYTWMDDSIWSTYEKTLEFLNYVHRTFGGRVPCKPVAKILEDGLIVGILTQTNQFVALSEPAQDIREDEMKSIQSSNYAIADKQSITSKKVDTNRIEYIHKIRLESGFFNVFRNTLRILLGQFKYRKTRERIEETIADDTIPYLTKLKTIDNLIRVLMKNMVSFSEYSPEILSEIKDITNCYNTGSECSAKKFCLSGDEGECALIIPKTNLINGQDNEKVYFGRMADEVIRYNRIKSFIFQPESFLAFSDLKYNLRENEIILLQSLLTQDYFENLVPASLNNYIKYNTYDTAQPLDTQRYSDKITMRPEGERKLTDCPIGKPKLVSASSQWSSVFPVGSMELSFSTDPIICTFSLILTLIQQNFPDSKITNMELKEILLDEYNKLYSENKAAILKILNAEGKKNRSNQVLIGQMTMDNMIMSSDYYMTNLDIWILAVRFNLPVVLFSSTKLIENGLKILVANSDDTNAYYFIKSPGIRTDSIPKYRLVVDSEGKSKIHLSDINQSKQDEIRNGIKDNILMDYIHNFSLSNIKKPKKMKMKLIQN